MSKHLIVRCGDIGEPVREVEFEPLTEPYAVPAPAPSVQPGQPEPVEVPETAPAEPEKVPA